MSDYEEELERTVDVLREKLQAALEKQERDSKAINSDIFDIKALLGRMSASISKLKRLDEVDYGTRHDQDDDKMPTLYKRDKKYIEKELLSTHDAIHDRIINLLDRFKE